MDSSLETVAHALLYHWISRCGVHLRITSDRGGQFFPDTFEKLSELLGNRRLMTTPYHSQANGLVERLHRQLKAALHCHGNEWYDAIPVVLLGVRNAWKEDIQATPAELTYGEPLRLPGEFVAPSADNAAAPDLVKRLRSRLRKLAPSPTFQHGVKPTFVFKNLATCSHVFVRNDQVRRAYGSPYSGPFRVISRHEKFFNIHFRAGGIGDYTSVPISIDRLKPAYVLPEDLDQVLGQTPGPQHQQAVRPAHQLILRVLQSHHQGARRLHTVCGKPSPH
ncbi:uncharacterized protein LOC107043405 [Diachasma alloeum]|uniref:uncharacterized protein LOC107043405 n=1 Tax=Diachasma alloeum TaxID=454923 RepID=UPI00073832AA|nr:uncharacterized protein LOC107043405 [Diachasma alloeum]